MKKSGIVLVVALVGLVAGGLFAALQESSSAADSKGAASASRVPRLVRFSGTVEDPNGKSLTGPAELHFAIYKDQADAAPLWQETQTLQLDEQGRYSVLLGAMQAEGLPVELFTSGEARWLGVQVGNLPEQPRVLLVSVPYALKAADAETLGGKPASAYALKSSSGTAPLVVALPASGTTAASLTNLTGTQPKAAVSAGATEFNDTTPDQVVMVTQDGEGLGLYALSRSSTAVLAKTLATSGEMFAVRGTIVGPDGAGVYGQSTATTGAGYGVRGQSVSDGGGGVLGVNNSPTGPAYGVMGMTDSAGGAALAARARATVGAALGVQAITYSPSGTAVFAPAGATTGSTTGVLARVGSAAGTALVVDNVGGGKLVSAWSNLREKLTVDGSGSLSTSGGLKAAGNASFGGNVGIGTSTPTEKLQVIGNVEISGLFDVLGGGVGRALVFPDGTMQASAVRGVDTTSLGGVPAANYARRDTANTFSGDQVVIGHSERQNGGEIDVEGALTVNSLLTGAQFYGNGSGLTVNGDAMAALLTRLERLENVLRPSYPNGAYLWSRAFDAQSSAVAVDINGNVLVAGDRSIVAGLGCGQPLVNGYFGFVVKYSGVDGSCIWSRIFMTTEDPAFNGARGDAVAVDASGNVLVVGTAWGRVDLGGGMLHSTGTNFVAKYSGVDGTLLWLKQFTTPSWIPGAIAVDASGNILVAGSFQGTVDFGGGPLTSAGELDIFAAKYSGTDGSHLWSKRLGDTDRDYTNGIAVDGSGNVLVTGLVTVADDTPGGSGTRCEVFVAKLSGADGSLLWSKQEAFGGSGGGAGIGVDGSGNVLVEGGVSHKVEVDGEWVWLPPNLFVAKYSGTDGSQVWLKETAAGPASQSGAVDAGGNVLVTGYFYGTVDFGGGPVTTPDYDIFVAKYSGVDGSHIWSKTFGGTATDMGLHVAVDATGNVLVTGSFERTVDFGGGPLTSTRGDRIFVLKLHP